MGSITIGVLADTHDHLPAHVLAAMASADEIWHLGDVTVPPILEALKATGKPLLHVRGNCDYTMEWPLEVHVVRAGLRIQLIHIPPRRPPTGIDLLLHGHTHVPRNEVINGIRHLNPGCITRPNRGAPASFAFLRLSEGQFPIWELQLV